jgi:hypothetical protein
MGQFAATTCQDAPQVVNMSWTPADRVAAFPDLLDAQQNSDPIFAPFTVQVRFTLFVSQGMETCGPVSRSCTSTGVGRRSAGLHVLGKPRCCVGVSVS